VRQRWNSFFARGEGKRGRLERVKGKKVNKTENADRTAHKPKRTKKGRKNAKKIPSGV